MPSIPVERWLAYGCRKILHPCPEAYPDRDRSQPDQERNADLNESVLDRDGEARQLLKTALKHHKSWRDVDNTFHDLQVLLERSRPLNDAIDCHRHLHKG